MKKYLKAKNFFAVALAFFLVSAIAIGCLSLTESNTGKNKKNRHKPPPKPAISAKHIILFIGDGMSIENEIAGSRYIYGKDFDMVWNSFPCRTWVSTWDVNTYNTFAGFFAEPLYDETTFNPVAGYAPQYGGIAPYPIDATGSETYLKSAATDSASAATAIATGVKTDSGNISWRREDPDDGAITTIPETLRATKNFSIGIISSVPFSHATPAAFVSHNKDRGNYAAIAEEIIKTAKPEVVIAGGHPDWNGSYMTVDQMNYLRTSTEYVLVERIAGQNGGDNLSTAVANLPPDKKLFGLFGGSGGNFEPPAPSDTPGAPSLLENEENPSVAEAVTAALKTLSRDDDGFFLMVEQGDIDWANHGNDYASMIGCMWNLDKAVRAAASFVDRPGDDIDWTNTLLIVTADHATGFIRLTDNPILGIGDLPTQFGASYPGGEVTYGTDGHTNELVDFYAKGNLAQSFEEYKGLWYPDTLIIDNTFIYKLMEDSAL